MTLDYANEWWVRLYTRDTTTWKLLSWEARSVLMHLLRKVDRSGVLDVGDDGQAGLAAILDLPEQVVADHLPALLRRHCVEFTGTAFILPNFIEAQETPSSDKQRKRVEREGRRSRARTGQSVTKRDTESRNVTESHAESRAVTNGHSEKRREEREYVPAEVSAGPDSAEFRLVGDLRPAKSRAVKHALPESWQPNEGHSSLARQIGIDCADHAERMRDWARSSGAKRIDWDGTFRNWIKAEGDKRPRRANGYPTGPLPEV